MQDERSDPVKPRSVKVRAKDPAGRVSRSLAKKQAIARTSSKSPDPLSRFVHDLGLRTRSKSPSRTGAMADGDVNEKKPKRSGTRAGHTRKKGVSEKSATIDPKEGFKKSSATTDQNEVSEESATDQNEVSEKIATDTPKKVLSKSKGKSLAPNQGKTMRVVRRCNSMPKDLNSTPEEGESSIMGENTQTKRKGTRRATPSTSRPQQPKTDDELPSTFRTTTDISMSQLDSPAPIKIDKNKIKEKLATRRRTLQHQKRMAIPGSSSSSRNIGSLANYLKSYDDDDEPDKKPGGGDADCDETIQSAPV